jgi:membrane-associated protease RseP (regulator of RpoE activity)
MLEFIVLGIVAFWLILIALVKEFTLEQKGITLVPFLFIMVRTQKFLNAVDTLANKAKTFWNYYARVGVFVSVVGIPVSVGFFAWNAYKVLSAPQEATAVVPVIPGVTIKITWGLIISIAVLIIVHEFSHGIVARREGISLKSMGLILLVLVPGAFVEPDEEEMKKSSRISRMKVYSAGSLANFIVAAIFLILLLWVPKVPDGILVYDTIPGTPAHEAGMEGSIIYELNGAPVKTYEEFSDEIDRYHPGETITVTSNTGVISLTLTDSPDTPDQGYMGIRPVQHLKYFLFIDIITWISMLNLSVALFNLFPISAVLDGGKLTDEILHHFFSDSLSQKLSKLFGGIALTILAINLLSNIL